MLVGADGWGRLDVRMQFRMHDGAIIFVSAIGVVELNELVAGAIADGGETSFDDQYYRTLMHMEPAHPDTPG